jgi:NADP-dependent 3-hydroxy acid dehydrogenase YdfG
MLHATGAPAIFVHTEVAAAGAAERAVHAAVRRFGRLDCVVNNAGVVTVAPLDRLARRDLQAMVNVNLLGSLLIARVIVALATGRRREPSGAAIDVTR